jgi:hypothetical protein
MIIRKLLDFNIFSRRPYEKPFSKEFIHAAKVNHFDQMKQFIKKNKYLIYSFDYYNMVNIKFSTFRMLCIGLAKKELMTSRYS